MQKKGIKRNKLSSHNPFKWLKKRKHEFMASVHNNSTIRTMEKKSLLYLSNSLIDLIFNSLDKPLNQKAQVNVRVKNKCSINL